MIEKALEQNNTLFAATATKRADQARPVTGFWAGILHFLVEALLFNGHSRCCVDSEIYSMMSRSHWLR